MVCEEFFNQGDIERQNGLTISMFCDRETTDIPKSQFGFLTNICIPLYEAWAKYLNDEEILENCLEQVRKNAQFWQGRSR
jgi:hypothetical protein